MRRLDAPLCIAGPCVVTLVAPAPKGWSPSTVRQTLNNEIYFGVVWYGRVKRRNDAPRLAPSAGNDRSLNASRTPSRSTRCPRDR